ncbi:PREDICTED: spermatogenesis-associated serine-rich protein 1 isoform X1 [Rhinopithecus bieti]|uniref:Spermatosis associated serine rich 1 n=2 Tax=Rhinopithecus TaxID=542827 RepID=A0A2K6KCJ5_RHIBE|nr:PREDICTED: spermatogenesis-associated serine-rich protein 1 isoform X1 [Rhinopithecus bieti]XP_017733590.1 PREDICTED: spermatogenesis-associated serine-rich protein 1 isoform X1 [Rhinopithecus bieti]
MSPSMITGNGPRGCRLPSISSATRGRELEKVPEKRDSGMTEVERTYSANCSDFLESKGCFANTTSSGKSVSSSSSVETGPSVSEPPGLPRVSAYLDTTADLDQKPSSSHSGHSLEMSLPQVQKDKYPEEFSLLKLQTKDGHRPEWTFYPRFSSNIHTYHVGKQCFFNGVFLGNKRSLSERTVDKCFGRKKYDIDPRNGIPKSTPGDNPYMYPEQSKGFHKAGSTLPPVNFSTVPYEKKFDTFIPLEPLPQIPNLPFWVKEKANSLKNEIQEVEELNNWQPAVPLMHILLLPGALDFPRQS